MHYVPPFPLQSSSKHRSSTPLKLLHVGNEEVRGHIYLISSQFGLYILMRDVQGLSGTITTFMYMINTQILEKDKGKIYK